MTKKLYFLQKLIWYNVLGYKCSSTVSNLVFYVCCLEYATSWSTLVYICKLKFYDMIKFSYWQSLKDMDTKLKRGVKIDESEIPPVVAGGRPNPSTSAAPDPAPPPQQSEVVQPPASSSDTTSTNHLPKRDHSPVEDSQMMMLKQRQHEYKVAALEAKRAGNLQMAADHLRVAKVLILLMRLSL